MFSSCRSRKARQLLRQEAHIPRHAMSPLQAAWSRWPEIRIICLPSLFVFTLGYYEKIHSISWFSPAEQPPTNTQPHCRAQPRRSSSMFILFHLELGKGSIWCWRAQSRWGRREGTAAYGMVGCHITARVQVTICRCATAPEGKLLKVAAIVMVVVVLHAVPTPN